MIRILLLEFGKVKWVLNITDVGHLTSDMDSGEDKLQKGAKREGKSAWEVAEYYTEYFKSSLHKLNFRLPDYLPKATENIPEQINFIEKLIEKGYGYQISDGIYFDTSKFSEYASFAQIDLDELQAGSRVEINPEKRNNTDFALWKFSQPHMLRDMEWDSPWGKGFPGWHIECSAMALKYLGATIDIHSGGIDHIPVHHTNEIAQSQAYTGSPLAKIWMHTNHILINDEKISKSTGNGITLEDVTSQGYSLEAFRLHVLESHYRTQSKFSWDSLRSAQNRLQDLKAMASLRWQTIPALHDHSTFAFSDVAEEIQSIMANDLHSEAVLTYLSEVTKQTLVVLVAEEEKSDFTAMLLAIDALLGTKLSEVLDISTEIKQLLSKREEARQQEDWGASDKIRTELLNRQIGVRDTSSGQIWYPLD